MLSIDSPLSVISQVDLTVNEVDGSNRVSEPSERTVKKIDGRDIKQNLGETWKIHTYDFVSTEHTYVAKYALRYDTYIGDRTYVHSYIVTVPSVVAAYCFGLPYRQRR